MSGNSSTPSRAKKSKKKLLFLCPKGSLNSGGVISNFQLIQYLVAHGYEARVITSWQGDYNNTLTKHGISNVSIDYNWWTPRDAPENISDRAMTAVIKIAAEIESFKPDVVITNTSHIPWGALAASMTNTPHIWTLREFPINSFEYLAEKVGFIRAYSNAIMANSRGIANYYRDVYNYQVGSFMSFVNVDDIKLGEKSDVIKLVSPNSMNENKNQIELIKAVDIIRARRGDLKFRVLIMGEKDKNYWPGLQAAIEESNVADILDIYDRVDDPWRMVSEQDILVQTSLSESIGRTTTEAMKLGVPVIASDIPGHREAFDLGGGTLYALGNPSDLADKIEHALDHQSETRKEAKQTQKRALVNMSSDACSGPFVKAIESVIGQDNPVGVNRHTWPYLKYYVENIHTTVEELKRDLEKKNADTDMLLAALEEIRNSRSYKLGKMQTGLIKSATNAARKARK